MAHISTTTRTRAWESIRKTTVSTGRLRMGKLEPFDQKRTNWQGLWYHKHNYCFTSASINLADLKKYKGCVRLVVRKNRYYNDGQNDRPNYVFMLVDSKAERFRDLEAVDDNDYDSEEEAQAKWWRVWDEYGQLVIAHICSRCGKQIGEDTLCFCPKCNATMVTP